MPVGVPGKNQPRVGVGHRLENGWGVTARGRSTRPSSAVGMFPSMSRARGMCRVLAGCVTGLAFVTQLDRVPAFEAGGCAFESRRGHGACMAQWESAVAS